MLVLVLPTQRLGHDRKKQLSSPVDIPLRGPSRYYSRSARSLLVSRLRNGRRLCHVLQRCAQVPAAPLQHLAPRPQLLRLLLRGLRLHAKRRKESASCQARHPIMDMKSEHAYPVQNVLPAQHWTLHMYIW